MGRLGGCGYVKLASGLGTNWPKILKSWNSENLKINYGF
jgi:hypothetical protein